MAKKLTKSKAREILHDKEVHGHPLTEKQRKFFGAIAGGAKPYKAQVGTMLTSFPSNWGDRLSDVLAFPQKAITKLFTGEYQTPSEAMKIENPWGAMATDMLLDPVNLVSGAGFTKSAKAAKAAPKVVTKSSQKSTQEQLLAILKEQRPSWFVKPSPKDAKTNALEKEAAKKYLKSFVDDPADETLVYETVDPRLVAKAPNYKGMGLNPRLEGGRKTRNFPVGESIFTLPADKFKKEYNIYDLLHDTQYHLRKNKNGGWLDKYDAPQAQNGIEGTMGGLTDVGFNYNGAWGGPSMQDGGNLIPPMAGANTSVSIAQLGDSVKPIPMQLAMGGSMPGAVGFTYARTAGAAPANGPYAKKTKASAQNGQEMKYYQEGLDFKPKTISQDGSKTLPNVNAKRGQKEPIIVSDPNDPRLKAYQDSLSLYNKGLNPFLRFYDYGDAGQDMRFIKSDYTPTKNWGKTKVKKSDIVEDIKNIKDELNWQENKYVRKNLNDRLALLNQSLQTGIYPTNMVYPQTYSAALVYKKPTQPIVLEEEPRFEKPIPIPRDTRDLGYTLPTPGQPRFPELYKYSPDTPTKFSFTSPTGGYNQQKTMYFPSKSALKSFTEGIRGATYQEGADYATATGTLQDGGDIPVDPMGYWNPENIGRAVIIPSNIITMEGVDQPLMGISDTGDVQYMEPGQDYEFDGEYVTEYPVAKGGVSVNNADAQPLKKLDQLLNFTNYNKPTKGGWLDKYK